ncbi:MAG: helix-turn-helix domain-containing protein [Gammaproteobacteria bacterium]|jgi:AcrR family transcriptional regulator
MNQPIWLHELTADAPTHDQDAMQRRIIEAAYELFVTFGLRRTTIEDIAKRAGVGRPTVYRRFGDKDTIVQAVLTRESRRLIMSVGAQVEQVRPASRLLIQSFVIGVRTVSRHPLLQRLLESEPELILPYLTLRAGPLIEIGHLLTADFLQTLQLEGGLKRTQAEYLLEVLGRLFISIVITPSLRLRADDDASLERLVQQFMEPLLERQLLPA